MDSRLLLSYLGLHQIWTTRRNRGFIGETLLVALDDESDFTMEVWGVVEMPKQFRLGTPPKR